MVVEDEFQSQVTAVSVHSIDISEKTDGTLFELIRFPVKFKFIQYSESVPSDLPEDRVILRC